MEHCLHSVKLAVSKILDTFPDRTYRRIFIGGKGNYREDIATMFVYKGNRDPTKKPEYYKEIREYLCDYWGAEIINGMEADDACGIAQWAAKDKSTVIVTHDKDLRMIPGHHYHWVRDTLDYVTLDQANRFFLRQMLVGDMGTDNVPGIKGIGDKKAVKFIPDDMPLNEAVGVVEGYYKRDYGDAWPAAIREVAELLWIKRKEDELNPYWK